MRFRRELLRAFGHHITVEAEDLPGTPDVVHRRARVAVFLHGCFWHSCPLHGRLPRTNVKFWADKFARNRRHDAAVVRKLRAYGWSVVIVWEHEFNATGAGRAIRHIRRRLVAHRGATA
jgi:DNA mismatch endonuclease, patch repair protein